MPIDATSIRSVRLKYAAEDAIRLADELVKCEMYAQAALARSIGVAALDALTEQEGSGAAASLLFSVKV